MEYINSNESIEQHILSYILNISLTMIKDINLDIIIQSIDKIKDLTGYTLFNKSQLYNKLNEIPNKDLLLETKNIIWKHVIMQIDFNTIFKSNLNFTFIIKDSIIILYKNKQVDANNILDIKKDLIKDNIDIFPIIYQVYIDTLCNIIMQFIDKDLIVKYYCTNIPIPYWKLFELKCNKINSNNIFKYNEKCKQLDSIISGEYYQPTQQLSLTNNNEDQLNLTQINELNNDIFKDYCSLSSEDVEYKIFDNHYRLEVIAQLNDDELASYLKIIEKLDMFDKINNLSEETYICKYIKTLIDAAGINNIIAKYYYIYKLYDFFCKIPEFIKIKIGFRKTITLKLYEIINEIYIIQIYGLKLYDALLITINKSKELIDTIEKTNDPNYVSLW
jgi:hypothetical protein